MSRSTLAQRPLSHFNRIWSILAAACVYSESVTMESSTADGSSALQVLIHPLVVMSIADHHTRTKQAQQPTQQQQQHSSSTPFARVYGLLFGQQDNTTVNVVETVEAGYVKDEAGRVVLQQSALEVDIKLFSASYPQYECLGWYSTATAPQADDIDIHRLVSPHCNNTSFQTIAASETASH